MSKNKVIIIVVCAIISFFIVRHGAKPGISIMETISSSVLYPVLRLQHALIVPIAQWFEQRTTMHDLKNNIQHLQKVNEELYAENIALKSLHSYAAETAELRHFNERYALRKGYLAQVLARHFSPTQQFFLVDAGASHGIKKDMVAVYGNAIVGRVEQVYPWYCKVCLITDTDCKVAATSFSEKALARKNSKGANGIHEGANNAHYTTVKYVSHLESVNISDTILCSGEGLVFPKGFALGKVLATEKGELFYNITVQPVLDFKTLRYCTLISKEDIERL